MSLRNIKAVLGSSASSPEAKEVAREQLDWLATHSGPEQQDARRYKESLKPAAPSTDEAALVEADELALFGPPAKYPAWLVSSDQSQAPKSDFSTASDDPKGLAFLLDFLRTPPNWKGYGGDWQAKQLLALREQADKFGEVYGHLFFIISLHIVWAGRGRQDQLAALDDVRKYANTKSATYAGIRKVAKAFLENCETEDSKSYQHGRR